MKIKILSLILFALLFSSHYANGQTTKKKVVLQAFWWDYWNTNYPFSWANYLTELAPRLREIGIDAVWIPPSYKNTHDGSVGYSPFDHYDLGDKYQKGATHTRVGTKDELLRMIAVMHANGIEVIQDMVINHVDGAGTDNGAGGQDPEETYSMATSNGYKNFRYVCWETPYPHTGLGDSVEYLSRKGRWSKNYLNFHPHPGHNSTSGEWEAAYWGPDICYGYQEDGTGNGFGLSTNAVYNPAQWDGYNRDQVRDWTLWFIKQTNIDGFRWDAVKHYPHFVVQDICWNVKNNNGWANRPEEMFNIGEYVGGATELDNYVDAVTYSNGGSEMMLGTFDFGLRSAIYDMVYGLGNYDLSNIPGAQQQRRVTYYSGSNMYVHRTSPFVNNHDTFRPETDSDGNYDGWNTSSELAPHIEPSEPRLTAAYGIIHAVDGNPVVFIEDLFNLGYLSNRWAHNPVSANELPTRDNIVNIIQAHQSLDFKSGAYLVPYQAEDLLMIERSGKSIILINDNWDTWQGGSVQTQWTEGTVLVDYTGANSGTRTVGANGWVELWAPPADTTGVINQRSGVAIFAPSGQTLDYEPSRNIETTQEWELDSDMGDCNCESLGQGGPLPENSTVMRIAGKVFTDAGKTISYELTPKDGTQDLVIGFYDLNGQILHSATATGGITGSYNAPQTGWVVVKAGNATSDNSGQKLWVKVSYTAPQVVDTDVYLPDHKVSVWTGIQDSIWSDCRNWETGLSPQDSLEVIVPSSSDANQPTISSDISIPGLTIEDGRTLTIASGTHVTIGGDLKNDGTIILEGSPDNPPTLIYEGSYSGSGNIEYRYSLSTDRWWYISPVVLNNTSSVFQPDESHRLFYWDEPADAWSEITNTTTTLNITTGYAYHQTSGTDYNLHFTGNPVTGTQGEADNLSNTGTGAKKGYNLIGNPYTAYIDFGSENAPTDGLILENVDSTVWVRTNGKFATYNLSGDGTSVNGGSNVIAPGQAFWLHVKSTETAGTFVTDVPALVHSDSSLLKNNRDEAHLARISISDNNMKDEVVIGFYENATIGLDRFDSRKMHVSGNNFTEIFTSIDETDLVINSYPTAIEQNLKVPISINSSHSGIKTIQFENANQFLIFPFVCLFDSKTNEVINFLSNPQYTFYSKSGQKNRFKVFFSNQALHMNTLGEEGLSLFYQRGGLFVKSQVSGIGHMTIFDVSGRKMMADQIMVNQNATPITTDLKAGIYIFTLQINGKRYTEKFVVW